MAMTSAEERQQVYDKLGLKSWEIAQAEAEYNRGAKLREMSALTEQFGAPKDVTLGKEFTLPDMTRKTFSEGGDQRSIELSPFQTEGNIYTDASKRRIKELYDIRMAGATGQIPENYKTMYSPQDQRNIEKLQQARSGAATDPELEEIERQSFFDKIDAQISRVPRLSPMMKEPTEQQKLDARRVKGPNGEEGYVNKAGEFMPFEASKATQDLEKERRAAYAKNWNAERKDIKNEGLSDEVIGRMAERQTAIMYNDSPDIHDTIDPSLDLIFREEVDDWVWLKGNLNRKRMMTARADYMPRATAAGFSEAQAGHTFMKLWQEAASNKNDDYHNMVPKFDNDAQMELSQVKTGVMREGNPNVPTMPPRKEEIEGVRVGEAKVTVHPDVPKELDIYWGSLSREDKKVIRKALDKGVPLEDIIADIRSELGLNP